ncbi:hypothetical protein [Micromonospora sp. NPDC003816]|uniref:hypothetical protein n=1 Tax=Micromonospora sp. NPDC003816 TaxID=3364224 RepID=UPI003695CF89
MTRRCPSCRAKLPASGRCPGLAPLIEHEGRLWGIAAQLAHALGGDVTERMIRNYANRDDLPRWEYRRSVYFALEDAAPIEGAKRRSGRGRRRQLDAGLVAAA